MTKVHLRLLAPSSVHKDDVMALERAAGSFRMFGVQCDTAELNRGSLKTVRYGSFMDDVLSGSLVSEFYEGRLLDKLREVFFTRDRIGIALTEQKLFTREGNMKRELLGSGLFGSCAFLSTNLFSGPFGGNREPSLPRERMVEALAKHEIGHVLMDQDGHCGSEACVMRANEKSIERFLDTVARELKFCPSCQSAISRGVTILESGAITRGSSLFDDI